jgi:hypothetical protein
MEDDLIQSKKAWSRHRFKIRGKSNRGTGDGFSMALTAITSVGY